MELCRAGVDGGDFGRRWVSRPRKILQVIPSAAKSAATCDAAPRRAIEKTAPGCLGYIGDYTTQLVRGYD